MLTGILMCLLCGGAVLLAGPPRRVQRSPSPAGVTRGGRPQRARSTPAADATGRGEPRPRPDAALLLELLAAMVEAGVSIDVALDLLSRLHRDTVGPDLERVVAARRLGADWSTAAALASRAVAPTRRRGTGEAPADIGPLLEAVVFAATTGAPSAALVRSRAGDLRRRRRQEAERRAASLAVRLVLPLGLCQLPAFICLGIVPVVISLLPALGS